MKAVGSIGSALALLATSATVGVWSCRPVVFDQPARLRMIGDALITDGRLGYGEKILLRDNAIVLGDDEFTRVASHKPEPAPGKTK